MEHSDALILRFYTAALERTVPVQHNVTVALHMLTSQQYLTTGSLASVVLVCQSRCYGTGIFAAGFKPN